MLMMMEMVALMLMPVFLKAVGKSSTDWTHMMNQPTLLEVLATMDRATTVVPVPGKVTRIRMASMKTVNKIWGYRPRQPGIWTGLVNSTSKVVKLD